MNRITLKRLKNTTVLFSCLILLNSCIIQIITDNAIHTLDKSERSRIRKLNSFETTDTSYIYEITGPQLLEELAKHDNSLVYIFVNSCSSDSCVPLSVVENYAEKKVFGVWAIRNNYNPIVSIDGDWTYSWKKYNSSTGLTSIETDNLSGGTNYPPFYYYVGTSNHVMFGFNPTGSWALSAPYSFAQEVNMDDYDMHGYFVGSSGSYNTNYHP